MESPIPPDPYAALGVPRDAQPAEIKAAHRKLVLQCHPDKVAPEAKAKAVEEFHKVQQAYELISDEEKRGRYDALVRMAELRRQNMEMRDSSARVDVRTAAYEVRTAEPPRASFAARGPTRAYTFDERRPSYYSDDEPPRATARKSPREYAYVRRPSERERDADRDSERVKRDEERKARDRRRDVEREADRSSKYVQTSKDEDFARYEESRRRRDREEKDSRRSPPRRDNVDDRASRAYEDAQRYIASQRPGFERTTSSRDVPYSYVRRSVAEARDRRSTREVSPQESRRGPVIVEASRSSTLKTHASDPVGVASAAQSYREKPETHRSYTTQSNFDRRAESDEPPFAFKRSNTMPVQPNTSSTRKPAQPSKLRTSETVPDSGYSSPATPERHQSATASTPKSTYYAYPDPMASSKSSLNKDYSTTIREPTSSQSNSRRAPSPVRVAKSSTTKTASMMASLANGTPTPRMPASRSTSYAAYGEPTTSRAAGSRLTRSPERASIREERERGRRSDRSRDEGARPKLYGEVSSDYPSRDPRAKTNFAPEQVTYARRYGQDDVIYASSKESRRAGYEDDHRPSMRRAPTAVF